MPDWTNPPPGGTIPPAGATTNLSAAPWPSYTSDRWDELNPPPKAYPPRMERIEHDVQRVTWFLEGDNPTPWALQGNRRKGDFDWNIWTRVYPRLVYQVFDVLTLRYMIRGHILATQIFWLPVGPPVTVKNVTVYFVKPASYRKQGTFVKIDPRVSVEFGPDGARVSIGDAQLDLPDIPIIDDEETKIDTEPTPNTDPIPPDGSKTGDPAEDRDLLPQFATASDWTTGSEPALALASDKSIPGKKPSFVLTKPSKGITWGVPIRYSGSFIRTGSHAGEAVLSENAREISVKDLASIPLDGKLVKSGDMLNIALNGGHFLPARLISSGNQGDLPAFEIDVQGGEKIKIGLPANARIRRPASAAT